MLLIKQLVGESNRMFANMLAVYSMLFGIDVPYKTVERLYSDDEVMMAIHNLHVLILKKKGWPVPGQLVMVQDMASFTSGSRPLIAVFILCANSCS